MFRGPERLMRHTARRPVLIQETLSGESQAFAHWSLDQPMFGLKSVKPFPRENDSTWKHCDE